MSQFDNKKAAALKYYGTSRAPIVVAAGSGYVAQKILDVAQTNDVPVYQDNSLATLLAQLQVGSEIPPELYQAIVEIYVYFLKYVPDEKRIRSSVTSEKPEDNTQEHHMNILSEPDINIADISNNVEAPKKNTYTLDELRAENENKEIRLDLLEDLLEDF